jgi:hypothetical protein
VDIERANKETLLVMKRNCLICTIVALVIFLVIIAIAVTLGVVLTHKHTPPPSLDDTISNDATFPNGSSIISVQSLQQGPATMTPLYLDASMLGQLGIRVDNSSLVAETGRLSYFYVRLPPANYVDKSARVKRQIQQDSDNTTGYIGVRFGDADTINIVPLALASTPASGLQLIGHLPEDGSAVYMLQVIMPESMCAGESSGTCQDVTWEAYGVSIDENIGNPGDFSNIIYVACGSQCDADASSFCATSSCQKCDGVQVAGADTPVTRRYNVGTTSANLNLKYNTYTIKDIVRVSYQQETIFDSGCVGTEIELNRPIWFIGDSQEVRVDVEPNCEGTTGTAWYFQLSCPTACDMRQSGQSGPMLMNGDKVVNANDVVYITAEAQMPVLVAMSCSNGSTKFQWTLQISPKAGGDSPICSVKVFKGSGDQWNISQTMGNYVQGGDVTLSWTDNQQITGSLKFKILGTNNATIVNIQAQISKLTTLWYAPYIPGAESNYKQFAQDGYPLRSYDNGYGLFQLTNSPTPSCIQLWSWVENTKGGVSKLAAQRYTDSTSAQNWMYGPYKGKPGQRQQAKTDEGHDVPVPNQTVGNCTFKDGTSRVIEDAVAIKMYNGAQTMYCYWKNRVNTTPGSWMFSPYNSQGNDYVAQVCKFVPK